MKYVVTEGKTPSGREFKLYAGWDREQGPEITCRRLEWLPTEEVGSVSVPLRVDAPVGQLFYELTRKGEVSKKTQKLCFQT